MRVMKNKVIQLFFIHIYLLGIGPGFAQQFFGGPHDFTPGRSNHPFLEKLNSPCQACHQAHNASRTHLIDTAKTLKRTVFITNYSLADVDIFCLRCHTDLTTVQFEYPAFSGKWEDRLFLERDLTDDHPVGERIQTLTLLLPTTVKNAQGLFCITCHTPHNSEWPSLLRIPPQELCQECHRNLRSIPEHEQKACHDCHAMHTSDEIGLTRAEKVNKSCRSCHSNIGLNHTLQPPPRKTTQLSPYLKTIRPLKKLDSDVVCLTCHTYHQTPSIRRTP